MKILNVICLNNDRVLRWRLIVEEYGTMIEYTQGKKYVLPDTISRFTINRNHETPQKSTYKNENFQKRTTLNNSLNKFPQ